MAKTPDDRYPTARDLAQALRGWLDDSVAPSAELLTGRRAVVVLGLVLGLGVTLGLVTIAGPSAAPPDGASARTVGDESPEQPPSVNDETSEQPSVVGDETSEQPSSVGDETSEQSPSVGDETSEQSPSVVDESPEQPSVVGDETSEPPATESDGALAAEEPTPVWEAWSLRARQGRTAGAEEQLVRLNVLLADEGLEPGLRRKALLARARARQAQGLSQAALSDVEEALEQSRGGLAREVRYLRARLRWAAHWQELFLGNAEAASHLRGQVTRELISLAADGSKESVPALRARRAAFLQLAATGSVDLDEPHLSPKERHLLGGQERLLQRAYDPALQALAAEPQSGSILLATCQAFAYLLKADEATADKARISGEAFSCGLRPLRALPASTDGQLLFARICRRWVYTCWSVVSTAPAPLSLDARAHFLEARTLLQEQARSGKSSARLGDGKGTHGASSLHCGLRERAFQGLRGGLGTH